MVGAAAAPGVVVVDSAASIATDDAGASAPGHGGIAARATANVASVGLTHVQPSGSSTCDGAADCRANPDGPARLLPGEAVEDGRRHDHVGIDRRVVRTSRISDVDESRRRRQLDGRRRDDAGGARRLASPPGPPAPPECTSRRRTCRRVRRGRRPTSPSTRRQRIGPRHPGVVEGRGHLDRLARRVRRIGIDAVGDPVGRRRRQRRRRHAPPSTHRRRGSSAPPASPRHTSCRPARR